MTADTLQLKPTTLKLDDRITADLERTRLIIAKTSVDESGAGARVLPKKSLYYVVLGELSQDTRNTSAQIQYLDTFECALSVFRTAALELRTIMDVLTLEQRLGAQQQAAKAQEQQPASSEKPAAVTFASVKEEDGLQKQITDAIVFSNRYALAFAGHVGLALLESEPGDIINRFSFGTKYDASKDRDELAALLVKTAAADFLRICSSKREKKESPTDDDLKYTLEAIFTSWINQFHWRTFHDVGQLHGITDVKMSFKNYSVTAGEFKRRYDVVVVDERFMQVSKDDVIGSEDFGAVLWDNMLKLSAFEPARKTNPYDPASVIFTYGEPGGGKTFTVHAYIQSFAELCKSKGIALWALTHSTTDYASHYQNKTANELAALAGKINAFPGIVIMYVADADNIFQSRKDPRLTAEQQQTLSVYFKMFDGTFIPKNGKFLTIMDANYLEGIDDATKSRLFDEIVELKRFSRPEHFAEYARRLLTKGTKAIGLDDAAWNEVGAYLLSCPLSNREMGHVFKQLRRGFRVPPDMIGKPYEAHIRYRNEQLAGITKESIIDHFAQYIRTRMEIERKSYDAVRSDDRDRFLQFLSTQNSATGQS